MSDTPLTDEELAEIKARADSALPGPWRLFDQYEPDNLYRENVVLWDDPALAEGVDGWVCMVPCDREVAEFIANARTDVPRLIADLRASRAEVRMLEDKIGFNAHDPLGQRVYALRAEVEQLRANCQSLRTVAGTMGEIAREWEAEVERLRAALVDAAEEMQDMVAYVPDYFRKKWKHDEAIARAKAAAS